MPHQKKRTDLLKKLYKHFAESGFKQIDNVSHLTKSIGISRSLFYFYFTDTEDLLTQLCTYHKSLILDQHKTVVSQSFTHVQYLRGLVEHKDLYFFTIQCKRHQHDHALIKEMYMYVHESIDAENFRLFVEYYKLEQFSEEAIKLLYDSFRAFWYDNSEYGSWGHDRVQELALQVRNLMTLLKSCKGEESV